MNSLIHDMIKIKYSNEGYLPDTPYHLVSDEEMIEAFMNSDKDSGYFFDNYYVTSDSLTEAYEKLVSTIRFLLNRYISDASDEKHLPNWIYSYMLGAVISDTSPDIDRHDLLVLLDRDNVDDAITDREKSLCLRISKNWIHKLSSDTKYLKILQPDGSYSTVDIRPPTMFGEPHIIKSLRLDVEGI